MRRLASAELDQLHLVAVEKVAQELLAVRLGGVLVTARDYTSLHAPRKTLAEVNVSEQDVARS